MTPTPDLFLLFSGLFQKPATDAAPLPGHGGLGLLGLRDRLEEVDDTMPVQIYEWKTDPELPCADIAQRKPDRIHCVYYSHGIYAAARFAVELLTQWGLRFTYSASVDGVPYHPGDPLRPFRRDVAPVEIVGWPVFASTFRQVNGGGFFPPMPFSPETDLEGSLPLTRMAWGTRPNLDRFQPAGEQIESAIGHGDIDDLIAVHNAVLDDFQKIRDMAAQNQIPATLPASR